MNFFEDIRIGDRFVLGRYVFTADNIKSFAARYDPQRFHVDEESGAQSHFGALCASGWHTATVFMRLFLDTRQRALKEAQARGERVADMGPALGVSELKWLRPVYAGDTVDYVSDVIALRHSGSRPKFGLMTIRTTGTKQTGDVAIAFQSTTFVERRPAE
jgi:acyl dehydratase